MRTSQAVVMLFLALLVLLGGCAVGQKQAPAVDTAAISAAIDSLDRAANAANAAKDTAAVVAMYADDAHMLPAGMPPADGREAIRRVWAETYRTPGLQLGITPGPKTISQAGDLVVEIGAYDFKALGPQHKPLHDVGKYVTVFKKGDAGWQIVVDTWNSNQPAPGQGK